MSHSFTNVRVHIIFHIKNTGCVLKEEHLPRIFHYIGGTIRAMSGHVRIVGGRPDHVHILASLPISMSLADFVRSIKSNSSRWIKQLDLSYGGFAWQEGYGAFSVSESNKEKVVQYIANQKEHHLRHSAHDEFQRFLRKNGLVNETAPGEKDS